MNDDKFLDPVMFQEKTYAILKLRLYLLTALVRKRFITLQVNVKENGRKLRIHGVSFWNNLKMY